MESTTTTLGDDAEFRGLFFGEGHMDLVRQGKTSRSLQPRLRIALRSDDLPVLEWVKERYGGSIVARREANKSLSYCWQLTGAQNVARVVRVLQEGSMPSKIKSDLPLLLEACSLVNPQGRKQTLERIARQHEIRDELKKRRRMRSKLSQAWIRIR